MPTPTNAPEYPAASEKTAREMGVNASEWAMIQDVLGRTPTYTELGMYAVMWSEHCGYKYSRPVLKAFSEYKKAQESGALENAGVVALGNTGWGVVFKMESHNHPSAVEPFQGAATGVGGILRDIFTMNARPIAILDSLRFGPITGSDKNVARNQYLFDNVVSGVGHYGNCLAGDERLVWRDAGGVHFAALEDFVTRWLPVQQVTAYLPEGIEALSFDPKSGEACWKPVRHVFQRRASKKVRIKTGLGRMLNVTADHPMLTMESDEWRIRLAETLKPGDRIPLLGQFPFPEAAIEPIDLIASLETSSEIQKGVFVALPESWTASESVRIALRRLESSADARHHYLSKGRMPLAHFLVLEAELKVNRADVRLFRRSGKANYPKAIITPSASFARMIGYYLSEGCVSRNGATDKIIWTFALHEESYVHEVAETLESLGLTPRIERRESTIAVYATSWLLGWLLRDQWKAGVGSADKSIPAFVFVWPQELRREVLRGALRGDGSLTTKTHGSHAKISFATASRTLHEQVLLLLQSEGAVATRHVRKASTGQIQGRALSFRESYHLEVNNKEGLEALSDIFSDDKNNALAKALQRYTSPGDSHPRFRRHKDALLSVKVIEVAIEDVEWDVYDIEVQGTHLFVTSGGIVTHNCVGVPTIGGEIYFHPCYNGNPLVNAMAIGVVKLDSVASAKSQGVGNPVLYVGSPTGRDGIHGATFASVELTEASEEKRANVQVGDPFLEKLLIEATLEALATGFIVGIQDMGAAGLTCGTCEMSAKGGLGMEIDVRKVPRREVGMNAYETMLSESQERMLAVVQKGKEADIAEIFTKWGLPAAYIGFVTSDGRVKVFDGERLEADVPARSLADDCPVYSLEATEPAYIKIVQSADFSALPEPGNYGDVLISLLSHPSIASKKWVWEQYDTMVQTQTEALPGRGDAAVLSVREAGGRRIAATTDCNPRFCYLDPFMGAQLAVAEAARNLSCVGAVPAAVTDCLNFPSPEKPSGFWQFTQAVNGMAAACDFFQTPVVSGNVSFYNETPEGAIYPTPTVGMVGVFPEGVAPMGLSFQKSLDLIYLLRPAGWESEAGIGGSEFLHVVHGLDTGRPPSLNLEKEAAVQRVAREAIAQKLILSAHDCSEGGLLVTLAESCLAGNIGAEIRVAVTDFAEQPWSAILFGEAASRIIVTVKEGTPEQEALLDLAEREGIEAIFIGQVKDNGRFDAAGLLDVPLEVLKNAYEGAIPNAMGK